MARMIMVLRAYILVNVRKRANYLCMPRMVDVTLGRGQDVLSKCPVMSCTKGCLQKSLEAMKHLIMILRTSCRSIGTGFTKGLFGALCHLLRLSRPDSHESVKIWGK